MRLLLIAYLAPIPAALVLFLMLLAGYGFPLALTVGSAIVLVPFAIAVGYSSYGRMTKIYLWGCIVLCIIIVAYTASLLDPGVVLLRLPSLTGALYADGARASRNPRAAMVSCNRRRGERGVKAR